MEFLYQKENLARAIENVEAAIKSAEYSYYEIEAESIIKSVIGEF